MEYIPRSKYNNPAYADAKQKELRKYKKYDVFEVVDIEDATDNIIDTDWILIEKERQDGTKIIEARMCLMGDVEELLHKIRRKAPTVNNKFLKILLSIAVSRGWKIGTGNVERTTSQSNLNQCEVFAKPPAELNLPGKKALKLNKTACGLIEASKVCYLKQAKELEDNEFHPLKTDPALFIHKPEGQIMCDAPSTIHDKDFLMAGKKSIMENPQQKIQERLGFGPREDLSRPELQMGSARRVDSGLPTLYRQHGNTRSRSTCWTNQNGCPQLRSTINFQKSGIKN